MEKPEWTFWPNQYFVQGFPGGSDGKASACNVGDLGWDDPLEEGMAIHSSILAWRIPWTEEPRGLQSIGSHRVGGGATNTSLGTLSENRAHKI